MLKRLMNRRFLLILIIITTGALALRLGVGRELQEANGGRNVINYPPAVTDMGTYKRLAELISQGDFQDKFYLENAHKYQPFYNSVFLPLVFLTLGYSAWAVILAQSIIGAITVYLTGLATAKIWNRQAAVIAALMVTFSQVLLLYTPYMLIATLQAFWLVLLFYTAVCAYKSRKKTSWFICGLVAGCAILTRGNVWFIVPGIIALAVHSLIIKKEKKKPLKYKIIGSCLIALIFIGVALIPQLPFIYRNSVLLGQLTGPSTDAKNVLSLGNTPESPPGGREPYWGPGPMEYPLTYGIWTAKDSPVSVPVRIMRWVFREPLAFMELNYRKLLLFWDYREIPNNISMDTALKQSEYLSYGGFLWTAFIIIPALAGLYVLIWPSIKKRDMKVLLLMYFILSYCFATMAFYILSRFRAPLIPLLAILGAIFINHVYRICKRDRKQLYIPYIIAFSISSMVCFLAYDTYRRDYEIDVMKQVRPNGVIVPMDKKTMYLDNGPQTFGGWEAVPFAPGLKFKKEFKINDFSKDDKAELGFDLIFEAPGEVELLVNGESKRIISSRPGRVRKNISIQLPSTGTINIKIVSSNCPVWFFVDTQRNYGRSEFYGKKINGEIVCRLFIAPPPQKAVKENSEDAPVKQTADNFGVNS